MRRNYWAVEYLLNKLFDRSMANLHRSAILSFLATALTANWKYTQVAEMVLSRIEPLFTHESNLVREKVSLVLLKMFNPKYDPFIDDSAISYKAALKSLIDRIVARLVQLLSPLLVSIQQTQSGDESSERMTTIKSAIFDKSTDNGQQLIDYIETICLWISQSSLKLKFGSILLPLLPYLSVVQTSDKTIQKSVLYTLVKITRLVVTEKDMATLETLLAGIDSICANKNRSTRMVAHTLIMCVARTNFFDMNSDFVSRLMAITRQLLTDEAIEAQSSDRELSLAERHTAILGLCAFVSAYPKHFPDYLPEVILFLSSNLCDVDAVIKKSVNEVLKQFNKTHKDNWIEYKEKFTAEQLVQWSQVFTGSSYFS